MSADIKKLLDDAFDRASNADGPELVNRLTDVAVGTYNYYTLAIAAYEAGRMAGTAELTERIMLLMKDAEQIRVEAYDAGRTAGEKMFSEALKKRIDALDK